MKANELMIGDWVYGLVVDEGNDLDKIIDRVSSKVTMINESGDIYTQGPFPIDDEEYDGEWEWYDIEPIPLTPEILEKNGFEKLDFSHYHINNRALVLDADGKWEGPLSWHWVVTEMDINAKGQPVVLDYYVATINYVHELQHALRLCGIDKEIKI